MKKLLFALIALATISCSQQSIINGTIMAPNGSQIVVYNLATDQSDTVPVVDSTFTFNKKSDIKTLYTLAAITPEGRPTRNSLNLIFEPGTINVNLSELTVEGGNLNGQMQQYTKDVNSVLQSLMVEYKNIVGNSNPNAIDSIFALYQPKINKVAEDLFTANQNNALAIVGKSVFVNEAETVAEIDSILANAKDFVKEFPQFQRTRDQLESVEKSAEGKPFVDFEGENFNGEASKLSDYVGKGKYVLVDFWASWCGPCKEEIPVIKEVYEKYKENGFDVVGVNISDQKENAVAAIESLGMNWNQIFDANQVAGQVYGVSSIPHIILFSPEGVILHRGLRGEELKAKVAEYLNK